MGYVVETLKIRNGGDAFKAQTGELAPEAVRVVEVRAMIDTGANVMGLYQSDIDRLGYNPTQYATQAVTTGRGITQARIYPGLEFELLGRRAFHDAMVIDEALPRIIGVTLLEALDLAVNPNTGRVIFNPEHGDQWTRKWLSIWTEDGTYPYPDRQERQG
jgi:predicted aspartyl protease